MSDDRTEIVDVCIRREDGMFLVVTNKKYGGFTFPGGKVEKYESASQAAIRELREETGLTAVLMEHVGTLERSWHGEPYRVFMFTSDLGGQMPKEVEKGSRPFWVDRDALFNPPCLAPASYGWLMGKLGW